MIGENGNTIYWSLLQAALWGNKGERLEARGEGIKARGERLEDEQIAALLPLCAQQGTGALVFPMLLAQEDIPLQAKLQMKAVCLTTMQEQVHLQHTLEQAWTALTKAGIQPVLMKGAGLAALYPEPQMRQWGDIDLFVGQAQYHPACAVMRETFPDALKFDEELDHYKHYNLIADDISMEIHRITVGLQHPIDARHYERMEEFGVTHMREVEIGGLRLKIFEPTFNALFVMLHAWEHAMTKGANVRQLCDLALMLHHYAAEIDRPRLKQWLRRLHLTDVWQLYMSVLVHYIGLPQDEAPLWLKARGERLESRGEGLRARAERFVEDLINDRMSAPHDDAASQPNDAKSKNRFVRKWHTMQERLRNARRIARYSPAYGRHMQVETILHGALRLFAKDRHWE